MSSSMNGMKTFLVSSPVKVLAGNVTVTLSSMKSCRPFSSTVVRCVGDGHN